MECKGGCGFFNDLRRSGINRNIVECKVASGYTKLESDSVLIETLWNVKAYANRIYKRYGLGINRNIVECKEFTSPEKTDRRAEY